MESSLHHIAITMDGNRRWAKDKGYPSAFGHSQGVKAVKEIVKYCATQKIPYLSLFAFSTENWKRASIEVQAIFSLVVESIKKYTPVFMENQIRFHIQGDLTTLPENLKKALTVVSEKTKDNQGLNLILAINYGGKREIIQAVRKWTLQNSKKEITEEELETHLSSSQFPSPDLMIRTGGVRRLSNFYLWTSSYSELYFSDLMWPDFTPTELQKAIDYYHSSKRRFGGS